MSEMNLLNLARAYSSPDNAPVDVQLREITLGLDIVCQNGKFGYYDIHSGTIIERSCVAPWKIWRMDTIQDLQLFEECLKGIILLFEKLRIGKVVKTEIVTPFWFSYSQKKAIMTISKSLGIEACAISSSNMFGNLALFVCEQPHPERVNILYNLQEYFFELSVIEEDEGNYMSYGSTGLICEEGWSTISSEDFEKRIQQEIQQFSKEINPEVFANCSGIINLIPVGNRNDVVENILKDKFGTNMLTATGSTVIGSVLQSLKRTNITQVYMRNVDAFLRLETTNKNLWISTGSDSKNVLLYRYTTIPISRQYSELYNQKLKVSSDKELCIYEGNFFNEKYDTLLASISLTDFGIEESQEIDIKLEINANGLLMLTVFNHMGMPIINSYVI